MPVVSSETAGFSFVWLALYLAHYDLDQRMAGNFVPKRTLFVSSSNLVATMNIQKITSCNPRSTASIAGHPIHPMLIPFPIAFFFATFVCDLVVWQTGNAAWAQASIWLLGAGLIMAALAAVAGLTDVFGDVRIRNLKALWLHAIGNVVVVLLELYNWYSRYRDGAAAIVPEGLMISFIVVIILLFTGWKGWEMVYRHRVGIADEVEPNP